jgi:RNA polymerase sigma-70 factor (ECF subfamily)
MDSSEKIEMIVLRCQIGDRDAFKELFEQFQPRLRYYIRRLDERCANTDDILQDIWLIVLRKIRRLKDPKAFLTWLYRIARNEIYGRFRNREPVVQLREEELSVVSNDDEPEFTAHRAAEIHKALNNIQPHHREVLTLCFLEEMPYQAIAEIIGCSLGTVKSRIFYAKQSLRKELESENE